MKWLIQKIDKILISLDIKPIMPLKDISKSSHKKKSIEN